MGRKGIDLGTGANTGKGTNLRDAGDFINDNFIELYGFKDDIGYTATQIASAVRKSINPYSYTSYLPTATPYTTPTIAANTPTKVLIPTTVKTSNAWAVADVGGGNLAVQYTGTTTETFKVYMTTSIEASVNNTVLDLMMDRNGVSEVGIKISTKISSGADVGALSVVGEFTANTNDYIEIYVSTSLTSTFTFSNTSILITEKN